MDMSRAGNSNSITRRYYDSLLFQLRYLDGGPADTTADFFGERFSSPIMTAALYAGITDSINAQKDVACGHVLLYVFYCMVRYLS